MNKSKEQQNRLSREQQSLQFSKRGQYFGFTALLLIIGFCLVLVWHGEARAAAWLMAATLSAIVGIFVIGKRAE